MRIYTSFAVFLFFAIALDVSGGLSVGPALLFLASPVLFFMRDRAPLAKVDYQLIVVFGFYFLISITMNLIHSASGPEYDIPLRFLLAIPAFLLLMARPPSAFAIWSGIAVGAIGAGIFAAWQSLVLLYPRAYGFTDSIQYGNISIMLGILCLVGIGWAIRQRYAAGWIVFLIIGALSGILGSAFTASRGSWLFLPFCVPLLLCGYQLKKKYWMGGSTALAAALVILYIVPQTTVKERVTKAVAEASAYLDNHKTETSIGARLEMTRIGVLLLEEKPWLGWGKEGYMNRVQQYVTEGKAAWITTQHSHLHNEYLDAWVKRGVPGLLATLILYLVPLILFIKRFKQVDDAARPYVLAGILVIAGYVIFGFTQAFLSHNKGVVFYVLSLAVFWASSRRIASHITSKLV